MKTEVQREQAILEEALSILMERMSPSKVARLLANFQIGSGDYTETRRHLFEGVTVQSLYEKALARRQKEENS